MTGRLRKPCTTLYWPRWGLSDTAGANVAPESGCAAPLQTRVCHGIHAGARCFLSTLRIANWRARMLACSQCAQVSRSRSWRVCRGLMVGKSEPAGRGKAALPAPRSAEQLANRRLARCVLHLHRSLCMTAADTCRCAVQTAWAVEAWRPPEALQC